MAQVKFVITLKNVKHFQGHEGTGLNADVYVNGVKTFFFIDDASGSIYADHQVYNKEMYAKLEKYVASLPEKVLTDPETDEPYMKDGKPMMMPVTIDDLVNEEFNRIEAEKAKKKIEKKSLVALLWGNDRIYHEMTWKGWTIEKLLKHPKGKEIINKAIAQFKEKYPKDRLLNKNIPANILN